VRETERDTLYTEGQDGVVLRPRTYKKKITKNKRELIVETTLFVKGGGFLGDI
jgi:hypothetical protein